MNTFRLFCRILTGKRIRKKIKKIFGKLFLVCFSIVSVLLTCQCEGSDRFYRPNLPEKLCSIGIIDADDTTNYSFSFHDLFDIRNSVRFISFEKSFQREFAEKMTDSLREFSFRISTSNEELYSYQSDHTIKSLIYSEIPDSINFVSGKRYYLAAKEKDFPEISAEITVPGPPPGISLISLKRESTVLSESLECYHPYDSAYTAVFRITFNKNYEQNQFYALIIDAKGLVYPFPNPILYSGPIDFTVRECNTPGFFAEMQGLNMFHHICEDGGLSGEKSPTYAYFIDGSKIPNTKCNITLSAQFHNGFSPLINLSWIRIKLLSIPEELYLFEKSLYTYNKNKGDPFSEPVYLNGNIKGGNGVFAICRSTDISIKRPFPQY